MGYYVFYSCSGVIVDLLFEHFFGMDLIENYHFKDKDYAFVALYAPILKSTMNFFGGKRTQKIQGITSLS